MCTAGSSKSNATTKAGRSCAAHVALTVDAANYATANWGGKHRSRLHERRPMGFRFKEWEFCWPPAEDLRAKKLSLNFVKIGLEVSWAAGALVDIIQRASFATCNAPGLTFMSLPATGN